ncbi:MAG: dTDP-4-dehydrorhamnose 3,5-epimerase [Bacteroidetes bacterium]|nr:MAG: dTDP-4-dehydrorhamnose 3,5-epimerase [Bacteroidota bacterium]
MGFRKLETNIPDVFIIKPDVFGDSRGFFMELYNRTSFEEIGLGHLNFVQDNLSSSVKGTIRGLHFQAPPFAQGKLITTLAGKVLDVAVDIRPSSPYFGQYVSIELSADEPAMIYIPEGFAHGFQVLSDSCLFFYKCTQVYNKESERGIAWDDPALNIPWRNIPPIVSKKDTCNPRLQALFG